MSAAVELRDTGAKVEVPIGAYDCAAPIGSAAKLVAV